MKILRFQPAKEPGLLLGYFDLLIEAWGNFIIYGIKIYQKNSHRWLQLPSQKKTDSYTGKEKYFSHIAFQEPEMKKKFDEKVLKILDEFNTKNNQNLELPL